MRINKYIASAGIASRRKSDELVKEGKVKVNGLIVYEPGCEIVDGDAVEVDGQMIKPEKRMVYIMLNKPKGFVTTANDERGRPTVFDLTTDISERIFPVGRLDYNTSGLLIMTNDGEFANLMMHPKNRIYKTYIVRVAGVVERNTAARLRSGVVIDGERTAPAYVEIAKQGDRSSILEIKIYEGRNRQIRKMCESVGHPVLELHRATVGELTLGHLKQGHYKNLSPREIEVLRKAALTPDPTVRSYTKANPKPAFQKSTSTDRRHAEEKIDERESRLRRKPQNQKPQSNKKNQSKKWDSDQKFGTESWGSGKRFRPKSRDSGGGTEHENYGTGRKFQHGNPTNKKSQYGDRSRAGKKASFDDRNYEKERYVEREKYAGNEKYSKSTKSVGNRKFEKGTSSEDRADRKKEYGDRGFRKTSSGKSSSGKTSSGKTSSGKSSFGKASSEGKPYNRDQKSQGKPSAGFQKKRSFDKKGKGSDYR